MSRRRPRKPDADLRREILVAAMAIFHREYNRTLRDAKRGVREVVRRLGGGR